MISCWSDRVCEVLLWASAEKSANTRSSDNCPACSCLMVMHASRSRVGRAGGDVDNDGCLWQRKSISGVSRKFYVITRPKGEGLRYNECAIQQCGQRRFHSNGPGLEPMSTYMQAFDLAFQHLFTMGGNEYCYCLLSLYSLQAPKTSVLCGLIQSLLWLSCDFLNYSHLMFPSLCVCKGFNKVHRPMPTYMYLLTFKNKLQMSFP